jgi:hypothetical protein
MVLRSAFRFVGYPGPDERMNAPSSPTEFGELMTDHRTGFTLPLATAKHDGGHLYFRAA